LALAQAGELARGATLYVTLEPCAHYGRTPPCVQAILRAGVAEVYFAIQDPNPCVNGRGAEQLRAAGVLVYEGLCQAEAFELNRPFFHFIQTGLPYVTAKFGMSLDGKIATCTGQSQWITNEPARQQGHALRQMSDALIVGAQTVINDDPLLTTRWAAVPASQWRNPVRVVVDSTGRVPSSARVFQTRPGEKTVLATTSAMAQTKGQQLTQQGVEVWVVPAGADGRVCLPTLLRQMGQRGWLSVMAEGGGTLLGSLVEQKLINRVWAFMAPLLIGGQDAPSPVGGAGFAQLSQALRLARPRSTWLEDNLWIEAEVADEGHVHQPVAMEKIGLVGQGQPLLVMNQCV
jgi:diaminohydroxyphosphoribosylaminopyrimidine deaminase/5-amino-6-(5-phosphoribosylamino)uracil reductase